MKKFLLVLSAIILLFPINSSAQNNNTKQEAAKSSKAAIKAQKEAEQEAKIAKIIKAGNIVVEINRIYPLSGRSINSSDGYTLKLSENKLTCYLPYFGSSSTAVIGGASLAIEAKDQPVEITQKYDSKKGSTIFEFYFENINVNEKYKCILEIYKNGNARINLDCFNRDSISYTGDVKTEN